jgi:hypothetical protein
MEFLMGLLVAVVFFVVVSVSFLTGYKFANKQRPVQKETLTDEDKEEQRKAEELQKSFVKLMNYDLTTALNRKKV